MTVIPIRPVFQNGQRLTAERLTQALEFLRTMLRRVLLAPLSSGVAGGFELTPTGGVTGNTLDIAPGLAIDGQGRLIVVPDALSFSITDIEAGAGVTVTGGTIIRICLAQTESAESDACSPLRALGVEEGYQVLFKAETFDEALFDVAQFFTDPNTVEAWGDLDPPFATPESACVTMGHLVFASGSAFTATPFFRDGVSPRFKYIRNTAGTPSILLNEANVPGGPLNPPGKFPAVSVPVTLLLGPNPVVVQPGSYMAVYPEAHFADARGTSVQATRVAPYGDAFSAGEMWSQDQRVFTFPGGAGEYDPGTKTSEIPAGVGGVCAVPWQVNGSSDPIDRAGIPLAMSNVLASSGFVLAERTTFTDERLIGVSAGKEGVVAGRRVVPVASSGIIKVAVEHTGVVPIGAVLTSSATDGVLAIAATGQYGIVRAVQRFIGSAGTTDIMAMVQSSAVVP